MSSDFWVNFIKVIYGGVGSKYPVNLLQNIEL